MVLMGHGALMAALLLSCGQDTEEKIKEKQQEITAFLKSAKTERELKAALGDLKTLADRAYELNYYDLSLKLLDQAEKVARSLKDAQQIAAIRELLQKTSAVKREYDKVMRTELRLSTGETKPEDYFSVGRFYALMKGDWKIALPLLAQGSDAKLKAAAQADLAGAKTTDEQVSIGDRWWTLGDSYRERAVHWYSIAWTSLRGIAREKVRAKLKDAFRREKDTGAPVLPAPWTTLTEKGRARGDVEFSHSGKRSIRLEVAPADAYNRFAYSGTGKLTFSFWVLSDGNEAGDLVWFLFSDTGGKGMQIAVPVDTPFWSRVDREVEVPAGATGISIVVQRNSKAGTIWIDDVSVKEQSGQELVQNGSLEDR